MWLKSYFWKIWPKIEIIQKFSLKSRFYDNSTKIDILQKFWLKSRFLENFDLNRDSSIFFY